MAAAGAWLAKHLRLVKLEDQESAMNAAEALGLADADAMETLLHPVV